MSWENFYLAFWSVALAVVCIIIIAAVIAVVYGLFWLFNFIT